MDLWPYLANC